MEKNPKERRKKTATIKEIIRKEIKARVDNKQHCLILAGCFYFFADNFFYGSSFFFYLYWTVT